MSCVRAAGGGRAVDRPRSGLRRGARRWRGVALPRPAARGGRGGPDRRPGQPPRDPRQRRARRRLAGPGEQRRDRDRRCHDRGPPAAADRARRRRERRSGSRGHADRARGPRGDRRRSGDGPHLRAAGSPRPRGAVGAGVRRDRRRQGERGARGAPRTRRAAPDRSSRSTARRSRSAGRERAVRPREGRVHRRDRAPSPGCSRRPTAARCSSTRSASCSLAVQAKLLRVARDAARDARSAACASASSTSRIVAATNRDLGGRGARRPVPAGSATSGSNAATVVLPPLRDRPREIALLARAFLDEACRAPGAPAARARRRARCSGWRRTRGRATSASCATR